MAELRGDHSCRRHVETAWTDNKLLLPVQACLWCLTVSRMAMLENAAVTVVLGHEADLVAEALPASMCGSWSMRALPTGR